MPNHIMSIIKFENEEMADLFEKKYVKVENGETIFDFNQLIPMPTELDITETSRKKDWMTAYLVAVNPHSAITVAGYKKWDSERFQHILSVLGKSSFFKEESCGSNEAPNLKSVQEGEKYISNLEKYGYDTWYNWCVHNWGTKWNSYAYSRYAFDKSVISFSTAWSAPFPVFEKLLQDNPDMSFMVYYADEDMGFNLGIYRYGQQTCGCVWCEENHSPTMCEQLADAIWDMDMEQLAIIESSKLYTASFKSENFKVPVEAKSEEEALEIAKGYGLDSGFEDTEPKITLSRENEKFDCDYIISKYDISSK